MFLIYGHDYKSPLLEHLSSNITVCSVEEIKICSGQLLEKAKICVTHEEALEATCHKMTNNSKTNAMQLFRNKAELRLKLAPFFPNFYFKKITLSQISSQSLNFSAVSQYVIKPIKGFFGIGVRMIDSKTNLLALQSEIETEMKGQGLEHPEYLKEDSLSVQDFLIEEYIGSHDSDCYSLENAEIAADGYYNEAGEFTLLAIYHHPYRQDRKYFHSLYYTSQELFEQFADEIILFFNNLYTDINLQVQCFPLHAEFRNYKKKLFLIEVNPGRFAGLGLSDLMFYAFGVNPYQLFFSNQTFNWKAHWEKNRAEGKGDYFAWVLGYKNEHLKNTPTTPLLHEKFKSFLGDDLIKYDPIDYDQSLFSIAFINKREKKDLFQILNYDFDDLKPST